MEKRKWIGVAAGLLLLAAAGITVWMCRDRAEYAEETVDEQPLRLKFGIEYELYDERDGVVAEGESMSVILGSRGVSPQRIDRLARMPREVFDPRAIRAGHNYHMFFTRDSVPSLAYLVYGESVINYQVFDLRADSIAVTRFRKEVTVQRQRRSGTITSSLWNCMVDNGMQPGLAMDLSDIYAWSVDFFGLQKDDSFTVIYDEQFVDSVSVGTGRIWGAVFTHCGKEYYAVPFRQGDKISYWDESGNSLRKNLLKAPLKYSRISSRFSNGRLHPILKIRRAHHAVDYAAPSGTPVMAVADGTVTTCGWVGGGGNTIRIKHAKGLVSRYMHLRGFAKGIRSGVRVRQGDLIGYVGSTGLSTGPHLDFQLTRNGTPIDPLKVPSEPAEPISAANRADFEWVRDRIIAEVRGTLADSLRITQLDSINNVRRDTTHVAQANR